MWGTIGGFFGKLFGSSNAVTDVIDKVSNGLDKLSYTDQEKAEDAAKDRSEARQMIVQWMATTQGQNLARRLIALAITGFWLSQYAVAQTMNIVAIWVEHPDKFTASAKVLVGGAQDMNGAVMLILAFYFAAPHMGEIAQAVIGKFTQSVNKG